MLQLWTISNLQRLNYSIRKKVVFYAPLTEHLDFHGIGTATYTRAGSTTATYRGGARTVGANVPLFNFSGETPNGLYLAAGATLQFNAANGLNNSNTLVWFESRGAKSTPSQSNPFDSGGNWTGNLNIAVSHIAKANAVLANSEINAIQAALLDTVQDIPAPPTPPVSSIGTFVTETPSGSRSGTVFTLSQNPNLNSLLVFCFGVGALERVGSSPAEMEYTAGGSGNRTITLGLAPSGAYPFFAQYIVST